MRKRIVILCFVLFLLLACKQEKLVESTLAQNTATSIQKTESSEPEQQTAQAPQETAAQRYEREKEEARLKLPNKEWILQYVKPSDKYYAERLSELLVEPLEAVKQARFVGQTDITLLEGMYVQFRQDGQYQLENPGIFMLIDYDTYKAQYTMELIFPDSKTNNNLYLNGKGAFEEVTSLLVFTFDGALSGKQVRVKFVFGTAKRNQNSAAVRIIEYCTLESTDFDYELFSGTTKLIMLF